MFNYKLQIAIGVAALVVCLCGCSEAADQPNSHNDMAATQSVSGSDEASAPTPPPSDMDVLTLEECQSLHSSAAKAAIDAAKAACKSSRNLPGALSGPECLRQHRYSACLDKFTKTQLGLSETE